MPLFLFDYDNEKLYNFPFNFIKSFNKLHKKGIFN